MAASRQHGTNTEAILKGLDFIFSICRQRHWSAYRETPGESAAWTTAYVLSRLGEIPAHYINYSRRKKIEESLDWLMESRTPSGGWGFYGNGMPNDADTTAWAVTALRQHARNVPEEALELVRRCRCGDGGFALYSEAAANGATAKSSAPDVTAIAVRALTTIDAASSAFLESHLCTDVESGACRLASRFFVSSTLLDWQPGMAPWFVVNAIRELISQRAGESAWEQALLLHCLVRLRIQTAWALAAGLRRLQKPDGSWPGSALFTSTSATAGRKSNPRLDEQGILATVTAVSALAMGDLQPGLYFGSDLPFRRL